MTFVGNSRPNADQLTAAELRAELIKVRDAKYPSKLARNGARLTALETVVLEILERSLLRD
jgi:hypothetical protein